MSKIRTVVVDEEAGARERIVGFLREQADIDVVAECSDAEQAIHAIERQRPDLVFLDVQIPACDGFGVIRSVGPEQMPAVVFLASHDDHALQAFEARALDYVLKPFGRERLQRTLEHAREHFEQRRASDVGRRLLALVSDLKPEPQSQDRLVVKSEGRVLFLRSSDVDWVEAAGNYVKVYTGDQVHVLRETMANMEARLDARRFVRIHRSRIVNADRIKELQPWANGESVVVLQNGARLALSRGCREKLHQKLGRSS